MKLAISNIAWEQHEDEKVYKIMQTNDITGLEVAPKRVFSQPFQVSIQQIEDYKNNLKKRGIKPVAMQALLYGHPELKLFTDKKTRTATFNYLKNCIDFASKLSINRLVFGSPKNRKITSSEQNKAYKIAIDFFKKLGDYAFAKNIIFCIEPNPAAYGTNFINTSKEGIELVKKVASKGFKLHLDLGGMLLAEENLETSLENALPYTEHFHLSHPYLQIVSKNKETHNLVAHLLNKFNYNKWVSIEMKKGLKESNIMAVTESLTFITEIYRDQIKS